MQADRQEHGWKPWGVLMLALGPAAAAVWLTPWFVTQDGPAHLYNAEILRVALRLGEASPYARAYLPRWSPVPNWGGHLVLMGLLEVAPARVADRLMTTLTMAVVPVALLWLRGQVWGRRGQGGAAVGAAVLGMSFPWLLGFGAFLLGMAVGLVTLGCWWRWRDRLGAREIGAIGGLLVVGYLGHLVALGLTAMGLGILAVLTEGDRRARIGRTALAMLPLGPLAVLYKVTTAGSGSFGPTWEHLTSWSDPRAWGRQVGWADPITLGRRAYAPLWEEAGPWVGWLLIAPAFWFAAGLAAAALGGRTSEGKEARPWAWLAGIGLLGALIGPDSFGADHGHYLPQRLALFGLAAGVVAVGAIERRWAGRLAVGAWVVALAVQTLTVWDYARESSDRVGAIMAASAAVGESQNVGTLLAEPRGRFRANPLLHADCLLGLGTGNVVWSNYETRFYYFPVQVRPGLSAPPAAEFEAIAIMVDPADQAERARRWGDLMRTYGGLIDRVVVFGDPGAMDLGGPVRFAGGPVRVAEPGAE